MHNGEVFKKKDWIKINFLSSRVHGEKGNVVFEMANPLNLLEHFEEKYDGKGW